MAFIIFVFFQVPEANAKLSNPDESCDYGVVRDVTVDVEIEIIAFEAVYFALPKDSDVERSVLPRANRHSIVFPRTFCFEFRHWLARLNKLSTEMRASVQGRTAAAVAKDEFNIHSLV